MELSPDGSVTRDDEIDKFESRLSEARGLNDRGMWKPISDEIVLSGVGVKIR